MSPSQLGGLQPFRASFRLPPSPPHSPAGVRVGSPRNHSHRAPDSRVQFSERVDGGQFEGRGGGALLSGPLPLEPSTPQKAGL